VTRSHRRIVIAALSAFLAAAGPSPIRAEVETSVPPVGLRQHTPSVYALTNARLVIAPGRVLPKATLLLRDGVITAEGAKILIPPDAVVRDLSGMTVYAGWIDAYSEIGVPKVTPPSAAASRGPTYWSRWVTPEFRADQAFRPDTSQARALRSQGFTTALASPSVGIVKGTSAVVELGDGEARDAMLEPIAALHIAMKPPQTSEDIEEYPDSPMGAYALLRQALLDADWYARAQAAWQAHPDLPRPEENHALEALQGYGSGTKRVIVDTDGELDALRADRLAREFRLNVILRGSGREYRRLDAIRETGRAIIVPLHFPVAPSVESPEDAMNLSLEQLLHWDLAPENPGRLARAGVPICLTADGLPDSIPFLVAVRRAVQRGLTADAALKALTVTPAALFGLSAKLGTLDPGRTANLIVTDGDVFSFRTKIREVWVDGRRYDILPPNLVEPRGTWNVAWQPPSAAGAAATLTLEGTPGAFSGSIQLLDRKAKLRTTRMEGARLTLVFPGDSLGLTGIVRMTGTVSDTDIVGEGQWPDRGSFTWTARRQGPYVALPDTSKAPPSEMASFPVNYPLGEFGRSGPPAQPKAVLFRNATVWTSGPAGKIEHGDVLVERGRIAAVGKNLKTPGDAVVIDCSGKHLTPGIIDCHSHSATDGGVNEGGRSVAAQVRIGDFIDPNDIDIYLQLAGGVTADHVLHGSADPIGGQCQLIKLRWGAGPEEMKFEGAIPTIKFALGENVKQSNWGDSFVNRYPQTRMGVEQIDRDEFRAARDYEEEWKTWNRTKRGIPPRRDLELDAIAEVLDGKRRIHCHSYRQDEILMLMRVCDEFGVHNICFQHVLEGYKVANEMVKYRASGSAFSDWWGFKMEVLDAIPYNGALMHDAGVVVSYNSDSGELARRLNSEAGKARKYGEVPDAEALKFVTLNPAIQLGVQNRVGSIEVGKDADLALWNGPPLSTMSRCEQTWIDGRRYFDRDEDRKAREDARQMREILVQKILRAGERGGATR
jgi:N-acetylglucosamine-6-phosphate deacetylase